MPLTEKGDKILHEMQNEYGKEKGKGVFYASANKGTITGVHGDAGDVPEVSYRSSLPSGATLHQLNETNHQFWAGQAGVGTSPRSDQGNNWTPGERKVAVGPEAMLTPPIQAARSDQPYESLFSGSAGQQAGDDLSGEPRISKSNFDPKAGTIGTKSPDPAAAMARDDKEDQLFPESKSSPTGMGLGQNPHKYLEPKGMNTYQPAMGASSKPTSGPGIPPAANMRGDRPTPNVPEYKPATQSTLGDLNKANQNYWNKNAPFNTGGKDR